MGLELMTPEIKSCMPGRQNFQDNFYDSCRLVWNSVNIMGCLISSLHDICAKGGEILEMSLRSLMCTREVNTGEMLSGWA